MRKDSGMRNVYVNILLRFYDKNVEITLLHRKMLD